MTLDQEVSRKGKQMREALTKLDYYGDYKKRLSQKQEWDAFLLLVREHRTLVRKLRRQERGQR